MIANPGVRFRPIADIRSVCDITAMLRETSLLRPSSGLILCALLVAACHRDGGVIGTATLPNIAGKFVIEDDDRTTALTSVQHSIYYVIGSGRKLVFRGGGGDKPVLTLLGPDDILVSYCGGSIYKLESEFFENEENTAHGLRILHLQPVTSAGLVASGRAVCQPRGS